MALFFDGEASGDGGGVDVSPEGDRGFLKAGSQLNLGTRGFKCRGCLGEGGQGANQFGVVLVGISLASGSTEAAPACKATVTVR